ncbi:hypothetical protein T439DRAFT_329889 [Meredithblackwellia eburnea MCA 4105]
MSVQDQDKVKKSKKRKQVAAEDEAAVVEEKQPQETLKDEPETKDEDKDGEMGEGKEGEEVPAMSHKEKRLAKRRKLALEASGATVDESTPAAATAPTVPAVGQTPAKSAHGIWVGNLSFKTSSRVLLDWFAQRGLKEVTRVNMPGGKRATEANRGFAYIDFPTATDVEVAVGLSEQHLDGRKLLIKSSSDYTGRPAPSNTIDPSTLPASALTSSNPSSSSNPATLNKTARKILDRQKNPAGPTLFIGNLGFETTQDDIREMFDAHQRAAGAWVKKEKVKKEPKKKAAKEGEEDKDSDEEDGEKGEEGSDDDDDEDEEEKDSEEKPIEKTGEKGPRDLAKAKDAGIRKVRLGTFEDTGKCKGWAFVDFHLPEQCTRALLNIRNHTLNGRNLVVEYASADAVRRGGLGTRSAVNRGRKERAAGGGDEQSRGGRKQWGDKDLVDDVRGMEFAQEEERGGDRAVRTDFGAPRKGRDVPPNHGRPPRKDAPKVRAKPGAALASAQRGSEAIVESRGKKITFD